MQNTIRRNLIPRLQQNLISNNHVINIDHCNHAISVYLTLILLRALLQFSILRITGNPCLRRNKSNDQHRNDRPHRFINLRISKEKHHDHQHRDRKQNPDHWILKRLLKLLPKRCRFRVWNLIRTKLLSRFLNFFICKPFYIHVAPPNQIARQIDFEFSLV